MNVMRAVEICALTARSAGVRRILSFVPRISIFMDSNESMIDYAIKKKFDILVYIIPNNKFEIIVSILFPVKMTVFLRVFYFTYSKKI